MENETFRPIRRARQQLTPEACEQVLHRGTSGVLAVLGDGGYPYTVPLSYVYDDGVIYFHCAKSGHKLDALRGCDKASFCVIDKDQIVPGEYTTYYRSVVAFGRAREVTDPDEMRTAIEALARRYFPEDSAQNRGRAIEREWGALCIVRFTIEHMTGKQAKELIQK